MVPSIRYTSGGIDGCTSSYNRAKEWNECCARVMGFENDDDDDEEEADDLGTKKNDIFYTVTKVGSGFT